MVKPVCAQDFSSNRARVVPLFPLANSPARFAGPPAQALGLALVLAFRGLYLLRFGGDPCGMNGNFLLEAKALRFGYAVELRMPLVRLYLCAMRSAGASVAVSLGVAYLAAHALFALGVFALARTLFTARPGDARSGSGRGSGRGRGRGRGRGTYPERLQIAMAIAVAILPALATDSGYRNISCTVGAALFTALAALLLSGPARRLRLGAAFALAAGASSARPESALCVVGLAAALALGGRHLGAGRAGAVVAVAGLATGLLIGPLSNRYLISASGPAAEIWGSYSFYAFYNASPLLMRLAANLRHPGSTATEYLRYAQTVRLFGGYEENGGSILHALLHHPRNAFIWLETKPFDLLATIVLPDSFTPLVVPLFFLSALRVRREGMRSTAGRWAPLLAAFAAPFVFLLFWSSGHAPYLLFLAPPLLLATLWGIEPWLARAPAIHARRLAAGAVALGALWVVVAGHRDPSITPALRSAAGWLQQRCAGQGCLVNALPPSIDVQAWADLQAGAPLPLKDKRAEAFALRRYPTWYLEQVRWDHRLALARARGWRGPILYVRVTTGSMKSFNQDFDPEHWLEGEPDLTGAGRAATFREGADLIEVFELPP